MYFPPIKGATAFLDGCEVPCPVHSRDDILYANVGPLLRRLTADGDGYRDSDGRRWTVISTESRRSA